MKKPRTIPRLAKIILCLMLGGGASKLPAQFGPPGFGIGAGATGGRTGYMQPRTYRSHTMLGDALIQVDPETRSLIVITDEDTNEEIKKIVENLDRPKPQVLLEVLFVEVTHNNDLDVGIEGSYTYRHRGINQGQVQTLFGLASITEGGFYQVLADDWQATLKALAEKGRLRVLSRPSILARNNQEAVMMVGQEVPFVTNTRVTDAGQTINTIQYSDVGIILRVTPFITKEDLVELIISPEISTLTEQSVQISETVSSPVIAKRAAETVVVTPNGKTVIIGGLIENKKTDSVRKVPLLGDIPLLGLAFRRTVKTDSQTELMIFLTPHIINTGEELMAATHTRVQRSRIASEAVPQENLQQFLDSLEKPSAPATPTTPPSPQP